MATVRQKQALGVAAALVGAGALAYWFTPDDKLHRGALSTERRLSGLLESRMRLDGLSISYLDGGHINAPVLVLVHGFGATKETWLRVAKHLTPYYRVIIPDLPGFGESSKPAERDYSIKAQTRWLRRFLERLGIYPGFHLAGHSMGGYIAGMFAHTYPRQVSSLWLVCPLGVQKALPSHMLQMIEDGASCPLIAYDQHEYDAIIDLVFHRKPWMPQPVVRTLAQKAAENVYLHRDIFNTIHHFHDRRPRFDTPLESLIQSLDIPILVSWGERDRVLDVSGALTLREAHPRLTVDLLENVGHMPPLEHPRQMAHLFDTWQRTH